MGEAFSTHERERLNYRSSSTIELKAILGVHHRCVGGIASRAKASLKFRDQSAVLLP